MKLAILDKDGTLVLPKSGNTFVQNPTDQILMVGAVEGCQRLIDAGYVLAIASNQGGVSMGYKTLDEAKSEMRYCLHLLRGYGIEISRTLFCPDMEGKEGFIVDIDGKDFPPDNLKCPYMDIEIAGKWRKPQPGMLYMAATHSVTDGWMIGDREEDRLAAEAAGFGFLDADEWRKGASPWII
jgi:D-glycero-D-manno-heptose 1,7-bisphosphate phosphatase